jgi:arylsulfatase A-like enzyme
MLERRNTSTPKVLIRRLPLVLSIVLAWGCSERSEAFRPQPNIILITIDTLRADHLGSYGYPRPTSPSIDQLAESGLLFERAIAPAPWTLASVASLHTSLYPPEHGATGARTPLADDLTTLAESLQGAGYDTMAFVTHVFVSRRYGLAQGFRAFDDSLVHESLDQGHEAVTSEELTANALRYLRRNGREPFFLWVHYFDPHFSYMRHPEFDFVKGDASPDRWGYEELRAAETALRDDAMPDPFAVEAVEAVYDEEIAFTDAAIGRLLQGLEDLDLDRPVFTALTADHGEYFMERGRFGHGRDVYDELIRVPLIISGDVDPTLRGRRFSGAVEVASLARTLAERGQVEDNPFQGDDLLALRDGERRTVFSYGCYAWGTDERKILVESEGWKLIQHLDDNRFELYDVHRDPEELEDRWPEDTGAAGAAKKVLRAALDEFVQRQGIQAPSIDLSPEEIERLEALGYVQ